MCYVTFSLTTAEDSAPTQHLLPIYEYSIVYSFHLIFLSPSTKAFSVQETRGSGVGYSSLHTQANSPLAFHSTYSNTTPSPILPQLTPTLPNSISSMPQLTLTLP